MAIELTTRTGHELLHTELYTMSCSRWAGQEPVWALGRARGNCINRRLVPETPESREVPAKPLGAGGVGLCVICPDLGPLTPSCQYQVHHGRQ